MSSKYHNEMVNKREKTANECLVDWAVTQDWQYFFTGTFKAQYHPHTVRRYTISYFDQCNMISGDIGNKINLLWVMEGYSNYGSNFLNNRGYDKIQGKVVKRTRSHVHAVMKFKTDPDIKVDKKNPHWMWVKWFEEHGRCKIEKVKSTDDAVRYCTKYIIKDRVAFDDWGLI